MFNLQPQRRASMRRVVEGQPEAEELAGYVTQFFVSWADSVESIICPNRNDVVA